jgi:Na+-translocating ferredoxin:NAD+ oxidoreductase RnfA subunit
MTPLTIWLSLNHGAIGGACSWLILNILMILIGPIIIHNKILKNELFKWYSYGLWIPLLTNGIVFLAFRVLLELDETNKYLNLILICIFGLVCLALNAIMLPEIRIRIKDLKVFRKKELKE